LTEVSRARVQDRNEHIDTHTQYTWRRREKELRIYREEQTGREKGDTPDTYDSLLDERLPMCM
jgi:hypothetical protein